MFDKTSQGTSLNFDKKSSVKNMKDLDYYIRSTQQPTNGRKHTKSPNRFSNQYNSIFNTNKTNSTNIKNLNSMLSDFTLSPRKRHESSLIGSYGQTSQIYGYNSNENKNKNSKRMTEIHRLLGNSGTYERGNNSNYMNFSSNYRPSTSNNYLNGSTQFDIRPSRFSMNVSSSNFQRPSSPYISSTATASNSKILRQIDSMISSASFKKTIYNQPEYNKTSTFSQGFDFGYRPKSSGKINFFDKKPIQNNQMSGLFGSKVLKTTNINLDKFNGIPKKFKENTPPKQNSTTQGGFYSPIKFKKTKEKFGLQQLAENASNRRTSNTRGSTNNLAFKYGNLDAAQEYKSGFGGKTQKNADFQINLVSLNQGNKKDI